MTYSEIVFYLKINGFKLKEWVTIEWLLHNKEFNVYSFMFVDFFPVARRLLGFTSMEQGRLSFHTKEDPHLGEEGCF